MVSDADVSDVGAHCGHDPRDFMPKHGRRGKNLVRREQ
jgi:hypothetical protein